MSGATGTDEPTLIEKLDAVCNEIFERWDKDQRSGKLLSALAGRLPQTYRKEVADIRRALDAYENKTDPYGANARLIAAAPEGLVSVRDDVRIKARRDGRTMTEATHTPGPSPAPINKHDLAFRLAPLYVKDFYGIAKLCDETLDRTGELLGLVRAEAVKLGLSAERQKARKIT